MTNAREEIINHARKHQLGHLASSLSTLDFMQYLMLYHMAMWDTVVLSKGHGWYAYGYFKAMDDPVFAKKFKDNDLPGCLEKGFGVPFSTGSLGHGLPLATGLAWGKKLQGLPGTVFCIVGDGELQEGSNWEAMIFASRHELDNLVMIVDTNVFQAMVPTEEIISSPTPPKVSAFGFKCVLSNGHSIDGISTAFDTPHIKVPLAIFFYTTKGYGVKEMEGKPEWHYRALPKEK